MRPWRIGTSSGTRVLSWSLRISTGPVRSPAGSQPASADRGVLLRDFLPAASLSATVRGSAMGSIREQPAIACVLDGLPPGGGIQLAVDGLGLRLHGVG